MCFTKGISRNDADRIEDEIDAGGAVILARDGSAGPDNAVGTVMAHCGFAEAAAGMKKIEARL
jgi:hypothetical protein